MQRLTSRNIVLLFEALLEEIAPLLVSDEFLALRG